MVSFDFIYDLLAHIIRQQAIHLRTLSVYNKMLLIGYLVWHQIRAAVMEEVQLNIAYRWFCGFELETRSQITHIQQDQNTKMATAQPFSRKPL